MERLIIQVKEIEGYCRVYKVGDRIVLDEGYRLNLEETGSLCMHSLSSVLPYYNAIFRDIEPKEWGLSEKGKKAYVQCLDPCRYTGGGTVFFEIFKAPHSLYVECHSNYKYAEKLQSLTLIQSAHSIC